jgi:hypothetical protein
MIGDLPCGYQYDLVLVSQIKRLLQDDMPIDLRARLLELIAKRARGVITMEAVAAIQPAPHAAMAMLDEMSKLSIQDKENVMRRPEIFEAHIALNPSILNAIKLCRDHSILETSS